MGEPPVSCGVTPITCAMRSGPPSPPCKTGRAEATGDAFTFVAPEQERQLIERQWR